MRSPINLAASWVAALSAIVLSQTILPQTAAAAASDINMPVGVTPLSQEVYGLHMLIFWICCVIGAVVFAVMFYSMYKHRKSNAEVTVKVTGYQWKWHYEYLDSGINFFSTLDAEHNRARQVGSDIDVSKIDNYLKEVDNPLVLPVGKLFPALSTKTGH